MYPLTREVLQRLHGEHLTTLGLLDRFDGLLRRRGPDRPPMKEDAESAALIAEVVANMDDEAGHHFGFEEEHLFPLFSQRAEPGIPAMLQAEHEAIRPLSRRLAELAAENDNGFSTAPSQEFHQVGGELIEREIFHIQKEEMGFLPAMDQMLAAEEADALAEALSRLRQAS